MRMEAVRPSLPRQAVFLAGGRGTRLGNLTENTPKPLLMVGDRPFLDHLIGEAIRFGIDRILLLCGYRARNIADHYAGRRFNGAKLEITVETEPAGTGGALRHATGLLDDAFFLANGDSCFDINWLDLAAWNPGTDWVGRMALRAIPPGGRYGRVMLDDGRVTAFHAAAPDMAGPMNAGLYVLRRSVLDWVDQIPCSLEQDVFPRLASAGLLMGRVYDRFFLDIGVPDDFARSQAEVPAFLCRPAAFLRLDGELHRDARAAVKLLNDHGHYVFMIDDPMINGCDRLIHQGARYRRIVDDLRVIGAHVDDVEMIADSPQPDRVLDCANRWPVKRNGSFLVTGRQSDLTTAAATGLPGYLLAGDGAGLLDFIAAKL
jgi:dTDP-glucose pyrophosphorylase